MEKTEQKKKKTKRRIRIKKVLLFVAGGIVLLLVAGVLLFNGLFGAQLRAADSVTQVAEDFYTMNYSGNYMFDKMLKEGGVESDEELFTFIAENLYRGLYDAESGGSKFGCSTLAVTSPDGEAMFGRNFDYPECKTMVVFTDPKGGYASVSTCDLEFLSIGERWEPTDLLNRLMAISAVYVPVDGMNEKGVCVAVLTISDGTKTQQETEKPDITTTTAVRMILDYAATTEEALDLLSQYDMHSSIGNQFKLVISDSKGYTVSVDYLSNEMHATEVPYASNFYQVEGAFYGYPMSQPEPRMAQLAQSYEETGGIMDGDELMHAMARSSQKYFHHNSTPWTAVFHTKEQYVEYCIQEEYAVKYRFYADKKGAFETYELAPDPVIAQREAEEARLEEERKAAREQAKKEKAEKEARIEELLLNWESVEPGRVLTKDEYEKKRADEYFQSYEISDEVFAIINGKSYRENPHVSLGDLRYLKVLHYNFDHELQVGELIVAKDLEEDFLNIFKELFAEEYEIQSMYLVDNYWTGDPSSTDSASIDENNTSCFMYRPATGSSNLSKHAYGRAIDINPQQNPYVSYKTGQPVWSHDNADDYIDRDTGLPHVITHEDICYKIFTKYGFTWGGDWNTTKDYQHFQK